MRCQYDWKHNLRGIDAQTPIGQKFLNYKTVLQPNYDGKKAEGKWSFGE
jgi:hypothetical protein